MPLIVREKALGVIVAFDKCGFDPRFSDADMRIAQAFANRAAVAIELSERVGRNAVRALLEGQELERKRLARELHDETGRFAAGSFEASRASAAARIIASRLGRGR